MMYKIYAKDGQTIRAEASTLEYSGTYMGERYLTVTVKSPCPVEFSYGDYLDYRGERFTLRNVPSEKRQARSYTDGEAMVYEGLRFAGYYAELADVQMCDIVLGDNGIPYTGLGTFSFYVSKAEDFGGRLQANLDRAYGKGTWTVAYGEGVEINGDKAMSIGGDTSCYDALVQFANDFDVNFTTKGRTITLGAAQTEASRTYIYGKGNGLKSLTRTADANQRIVTKLRAYGSTKNVPYDYYNKVSGEVRSEVKGLLKGVRGGKTCYGVCLKLPKAYLADSVTLELPDGEGTFEGTWGAAQEGDVTSAAMEVSFGFNKEISPPLEYKGRRYQASLTVGTPTLAKGTYRLNAGAVNTHMSLFGNGNSNWEITFRLQLWNRRDFMEYMGGQGGSPVAEIAAIKQERDTEKVEFEDTWVNVGEDVGFPTLVVEAEVSGKVSVGSFWVENTEELGFSEGEEPDGYFIHVCDGSDDAAYEGMYGYLIGGLDSVQVKVAKGADKENVPSEYLYYDRADGKSYYVANLMMPGYPDESLAEWAARVSAEDTETGRKVATLIEEGFTFSEDKALPYIVSPRAAEYGMKEGEVIFDGSDEDWDEVCPSLEGMTTAELATVAGYAGSETYNSGGELDRILGGSEIEDNGVSATGGYGDGYKDTEGVLMKSSFEVTIPNIGFDLWGQLADGQTPVIYMNSGMCAGRKFEILKCVPVDADSIDKGYNLTVERELDEAVNMYYPNSTFGLSAGDRYVIEGIEMPGVYVKAASVRAFFEAVEWLKANDHAAYTYQPEMDNVYLARNPGYGAELVEGMKMPFTDAEMGIGLQAVTISQLVIKEGEADIAQYEVTLDDEEAAELLTANLAGGQAQGAGGTAGGQGVKLIKTGDTTPASDSNVFSALRSLATFLRKDKADSTRFLLSLFGGAVFGSDGFASGMSGFGARIDEGGEGEMESLTVRRELIVPQLSYNRVDIKVGDKWRAPGGGVIASVDTEARRCTLRLADGEIGAVAVGDICMGIFHSEVSADNSTDDYDDSKGNRRFAGFTTVYFTITGVEGERNETFTYQLRPAEEGHWTGQAEPFEEMQFVCYGSFSNEARQTSVYETRTYTRMLWKQNTWEISKANIALQYGDLSNLSVFEMQMQGYSMYLNSVYFTGEITQVKPDGTPVRTANDRGAWQQGHYDYYDRVSHGGCIWLCVAEGGTDTEPADGNAAWLKQVDKGSQGQKGEKGDKGDKGDPGAQGLQGLQGEKGEQGIPGQDGKDGRTTYFHIKYSANADGSGMKETPDVYIGTYVDFDEADSTDPKAYTWARFQGLQGEQGTQGIPGVNGADGTTYYLHIKYSNDGGATFTGNAGEDSGAYIGVLTDTNVNDSTDPKAYKWSKIKGDKGDQGQKGDTGAKGDKGDQGDKGEKGEKGDTGADGTSPVMLGRWKTGTHVPYLGMVRMGGSTWACTVAGGTDNPPLWTLTDAEGSRLTDPQGYYLLTGEENSAEYKLVAEDGQDGKPGDKGDPGADGKGIKTVTNYYAVSASGTEAPTSWQTTPPATDETSRYLWHYSVTTYTDGTTTETPKAVICVHGVNGNDGLNGCAIRESEWAAGVDYRNDEGLASTPDGARYLDIVLVRNDAVATGWDAYRCKTSHKSSASLTYANGDYWDRFDANMGAIFTSLIIAKNAKIRFLQGNQITVEKPDGTVTAGMSGSQDGLKTRFWAGSATADSAPFRVDEPGKLTATDAEVTGTVNATAGRIGGFRISNNDITNEGFDNNASVIFRNDREGKYAAMGGNVLPSVSGVEAVGSFENHDATQGLYNVNYALLLSARGVLDARALAFEGGSVCGLAMRNTLVSSSQTLTRYDYNVVCVNSSTITITLPTMQLYDDGHVIRIRQMNTATVKVKASPCYTYNGTSTRYSAPLIQFSSGENITPGNALTSAGQGYAIELVWVRDITKTIGSTTYYGSWVMYRLSSI